MKDHSSSILCNFLKIFQNLLFTGLLLLSACTHVVKKDGPPNFYVDASKIPNAVPTAESKSKFGNPPVYAVFGKRYHVMKSSKNYEAIGVASWYGTKFHSRKTSSGERYNMLAMTAAHKSLPLPTYVEVTNLENRRQIIVKVNDRGPFERNRLIDLSYVAAKKLGIAGRGTGLVKVKAIDPVRYWHPLWISKSTPHHSPVFHVVTKKSGIPNPFFVQVGPFPNKINS